MGRGVEGNRGGEERNGEVGVEQREQERQKS